MRIGGYSANEFRIAIYYYITLNYRKKRIHACIVTTVSPGSGGSNGKIRDEVVFCVQGIAIFPVSGKVVNQLNSLRNPIANFVPFAEDEDAMLELGRE
jgi:hypothetical protein